ncbi:MAG: ferritin family protein [Candidatus Omnitrophica bacterium]|nr:ferritin family protein [Candidatus Omnitrophota bacterium]
MEKKLQDLLKEAIEMEEKGYKFYQEASKKAKDEVVRKTFDFLANNEILHIESIKELYNTLKDKGELPQIELEDKKRQRMKDLSIFSKGIKELSEKIKPDDDDIKTCEFAMEFENNGYKYYEKMLKEAKDENLIKLLKFLLQEEKEHYESIMNLHTYITDSANWYMYEEGSFPQG